MFNIQGESLGALPNLSNSEQIIDLSDKPAGIYFVKVTGSSGELIAYQRIIIKK
ncbi:MAG: T9SS type A sorting domain-containing protein [Bacteroidia bacterium]|nr:T9SS type A sorting domain-containing protein [Bacteroidia bacterium]